MCQRLGSWLGLSGWMEEGTIHQDDLNILSLRGQLATQVEMSTGHLGIGYEAWELDLG